MTGREIERLGHSAFEAMHNLADRLLDIGVDALNGSRQSDDRSDIARIAICGDYDPRTFAPRAEEEEGGPSRFLPALSIGVAAVKQSDVGPAEVFEEMHGYLEGLKGGVKRSEKTTSTRAIVKQLNDGRLDVLEGIAIEECSAPDNQVSRTREAFLPLRGGSPVSLIVPLNWRVFREEREIPDEFLNVPLWAAATGGRKIEGGSGEHKIERDPNYSSYQIAYPVRPPDAPKGEGFSKEMPGITFTDIFSRTDIELPGVDPQPNIAYKVLET